MLLQSAWETMTHSDVKNDQQRLAEVSALDQNALATAVARSARCCCWVLLKAFCCAGARANDDPLAGS